jgi:ribosomal protein S18 acetylase RimI-like enzyme
MKRTEALEIVPLRPDLIESLGELFEEITSKGQYKFFHPHPFTRAEAERLCRYTGKDLYCVLSYSDRILGYGMLRGWDQGYTIPSLGIFIRDEAQCMGLGKLMMLYLHAAARFKGADSIRLKVYEHNDRAKRLYEQLGYVFNQREGEQLVGVCMLK